MSHGATSRPASGRRRGPGATIAGSPRDLGHCPVGRSPYAVVTASQRARLVVAMGLLNLVLATVALTAGLVAPAQPDRGIAGGASPVPSVVAPGGSSQPPAASPSTSGPGGTPTTSSPVPGASGSAPPASASPSPSIEPSSSATPSGPIVAVGPTPTPTPTAPPVVNRTPSPTATPRSTATPRPTQPAATPSTPTPKPTPRPTARPTPSPTPAPAVGKIKKPRPPCPSADNRPPGHNKTDDTTRPCGGKGDNNGKGGSGVVIVLPLALLGAAATGRRRLVSGARHLRGMGRRRSA